MDEGADEDTDDERTGLEVAAEEEIGAAAVEEAEEEIEDETEE